MKICQTCCENLVDKSEYDDCQICRVDKFEYHAFECEMITAQIEAEAILDLENLV